MHVHGCAYRSLHMKLLKGFVCLAEAYFVERLENGMRRSMVGRIRKGAAGIGAAGKKTQKCKWEECGQLYSLGEAEIKRQRQTVDKVHTKLDRVLKPQIRSLNLIWKMMKWSKCAKKLQHFHNGTVKRGAGAIANSFQNPQRRTIEQTGQNLKLSDQQNVTFPWMELTNSGLLKWGAEIKPLFI